MSQPLTTHTIAGRAWQCRPACNDHHIVDEVIIQNTYRLPTRLPLGSVVVDIGAHIGSFSVLALERGASAVYAFEADRGNYALARQHLQPYGARAQLYHLAVVRSDGLAPARLRVPPYPPFEGLLNTGGVGVFAEAGETVDTITFDEALRLIDGGPGVGIDLVKLDCEGSEFPILLTSQQLGRVRSLAGEFHEYCRHWQTLPIPEAARVHPHTEYTREVLREHLTRQGFAVELVPYRPDHHLGRFFARREGT